MSGKKMLSIDIEVVSKPSIGLKVKADWAGQPQEYREYFEDWMSQSNTACPVVAIAKMED